MMNEIHYYARNSKKRHIAVKSRAYCGFNIIGVSEKPVMLTVQWIRPKGDQQ